MIDLNVPDVAARLERLCIRPEKSGIVAYSCYFGEHEPFNPYAMREAADCDRVIFTDRAELELDQFQFRVIRLSDHFPDWGSKVLSRLPKLWPELFFREHDWCYYIDNRARFLRSPSEIIAQIISERAREGKDTSPGRYLFRHARRDCAWREARLCLQMGHLSEEEFTEVRARFKRERFPRRRGLYVNTTLIERMGSPAYAALNRDWFELFCNLAGRDQILLPYLLWRHGIEPETIPHDFLDFVHWPVFGKRIRDRFRRGRPMPKWLDHKMGHETRASGAAARGKGG